MRPKVFAGTIDIAPFASKTARWTLPTLHCPCWRSTAWRSAVVRPHRRRLRRSMQPSRISMCSGGSEDDPVERGELSHGAPCGKPKHDGGGKEQR
jgi:hypothetical protein